MDGASHTDDAALRAAAENGDVAAILGLVDLHDARSEFSASAAWLGIAARAGSIEGIAQLGARTALGAGVTADFAAAGSFLDFAAERGHPAAARWLARLAVIGVLPETAGVRVASLLARDARAGDAASLSDLAELTGEQDEAEYARTEDYLQAVNPALWRRPLDLEPLSEHPLIGVCQELLPPPVRARIIADARPFMAPAGVTDRSTGQFALDAARTNSSTQLAFFTQPLALVLAKRRAAVTAGEPAVHLERTNVLHYREREEFAPHWDYLDPASPGFTAELAEQGQRIATCLLGLNEDYAGGETDFPALGLRVRIPAGGALFFRNLDSDGRPEPDTLHAGMPVIRGTKWVVSQWIRSRPQPL